MRAPAAVVEERRPVWVALLAGQLQRNKYGVPEIPTTTFVEGTWFDGATCPPRKPASGAPKVKPGRRRSPGGVRARRQPAGWPDPFSRNT